MSTLLGLTPFALTPFAAINGIDPTGNLSSKQVKSILKGVADGTYKDIAGITNTLNNLKQSSTQKAKLGYSAYSNAVRDTVSAANDPVGSINVLRDPVASKGQKAQATIGLVGFGGSLFYGGGSIKGLKAVDELGDAALVCRGGLCTADSFLDGAEEVTSNGILNGISVNAANKATPEMLATGLKNNKVGFTTVQAIKDAGGTIIKTGNQALHYVINGLTASQLESLFKSNVIDNIWK